MAQKHLYFVLGAPGAGKGTQCERIKQVYGWEHISAGDLLRNEVASRSPQGDEIKAIMEQGQMVPSAVIVGLLQKAVASLPGPHYLIDGFPRKVDQALEFEHVVQPCVAALYFSVDEETARQRLLARAATSGRIDDNAETIAKRFRVYESESMPVIEFLKESGRVIEISSAAPPDEVFDQVKLVIDGLLAQQAVPGAAPPAASLPEQLAAAESSAAHVGAAEAAGAAAALAAADVVAAGPSDGGAVAAEAAAAEAAAVQAAAAQAAATEAAAAEEAAAEAAAAEAAAADAAAAKAAAELAALKERVLRLQPPLVICGPSGVGKGTLIGRLLQDFPDRFGFSVSHTTRDPRPGEVDGVQYHFTSRSDMEPQVAAGLFLEHADVHGNMYGTSLRAVADVGASGKMTVLDIDVQGARQVKTSVLGGRALFVFVAPPSDEELERRLRGRGTETEDKIQKRLANAKAELAAATEPGLFHRVVVNDDLEAAYQRLKATIEELAPGTLPEALAAPVPEEPPAAAPVAAAPAALAAPAPVAAGHVAAPAAPAATAAVLDFGFGAAAGPGVVAKGMPVRQYMDATVVPALREALKALNTTRPDDPLLFLAQHLMQQRSELASGAVGVPP